MENRIKSKNFVVIPGWAVTELGLKGNALIIYSVIYGFSQVEGVGHCFKGSIDYLAEWTNSTRTGVERVLKDLVEEGLLEKTISSPTNIYKAVDPDIVINKRKAGLPENLGEGLRKSEGDTQNILDNNINNKNNNKDSYTKKKEINEKTEEIIKYFNKVCKTTFKSNTTANRDLVKGLLNLGFTLDDMKTVIDSKYDEWGKKPYKFQNGMVSTMNLTPDTLFGNRFESYLYKALVKDSSENMFESDSISSDEVEVDSKYRF